jgi:hypothetical protein
MGKCIFRSGAKICGLQTAPLSQFCELHQPDTGDELTLRAPFPERWGDEIGVGEQPYGDRDSVPKIK